MSLTGAYDPDNIFAKILRGEIPNVTVWQDDDVLAFMDVFPQAPGHVLVIHKRATARTLLEQDVCDYPRQQKRLYMTGAQEALVDFNEIKG